MRKAILLSALLFAAAYNFSNAQDKHPFINPGKVIEEALVLRDSARFDDAAKTLLTIDKSDTSYNYMLTELAATYLSAKKYKEAIETANQALKTRSIFTLRLNLIKGNALDQGGSPDSAITLYKATLKKYPYSYLLYYNLGLTYSNQKKYDEALKAFQQTLKFNPFHGSTHLVMGRISALMGHYTHAILSLETILAIDPNSQRSNPNLVFLNNFLNNALDPTYEKITPTGKNAFEELDQVFKSGIALNKGYKLKLSFDAPVSRQSQLLFESLEYKEKTNDYWMDTYVPIFMALKQGNFMESFIYRILTTAPDKTIANQLKKHEKSLKEMSKLLGDKISGLHTNYKLTEDGKERIVDIFLNEDDYLISMGKFKADGETHYGRWNYFFTNGELKEDGFYNDSGKLEGKWLTYNRNGTLSFVENYSNGDLYGDYIGYYPSGNKKFDAKYIKGQAEGDVRYYYDCDAVSSVIPFKNGSRNGKGISYYKNGTVKEEFFYKNDSLENENRAYYANGSLKWIYYYASNKLSGKAIDYFINGKIEKESEYINGELNGPYKVYYSNGKLSTSGTNKKGIAVGEWKEYNKKGIVTEISHYDDKGNLDGEMKGFDDNGKPYFAFQYDNGKLKQYLYFNADGTTMASGKIGNAETTVKGYYADGNMLYEGTYKNGLMDGSWTYYYKTGIKKYTKVLKDSRLNGPYITFYKTGEKNEDKFYKDGVLNGYYQKFNTDGIIISEGWYVDGEQEGKWIYNNQDGTLESTCYFISGEINGDYDNYVPDQKLRNQRNFKLGEINYLESFNPEGKSIAKINFNGKEKYNLVYKDGTLRSTGNFDCNEFNSSYKFLYKNGKPEVENTYLNGMKYGAYNAYYPSGKIQIEGKYVANNMEGIWKYYNETGFLYRIACYKNNEADSTWITYHNNGKLKSVEHFEDDELIDTAKYYNPLGEFMFAIIYDSYGLTGYQYDGPKGLVIEKINPKDTGTFVTYFKNGQVSSRQPYKYGTFQGMRVYYYSNGTTYREETVQDNSFNGKVAEYFPNGKIRKTENYLKNDNHGTFKNFREDGTIESSKEYKYDDCHGAFIYYDKKGNKEKTETYWGDIQL